ncbi:hypothetical protein GCM10009651_32890 [Microbacterium natoriense]
MSYLIPLSSSTACAATGPPSVIPIVIAAAIAVVRVHLFIALPFGAALCGFGKEPRSAVPA